MGDMKKRDLYYDESYANVHSDYKRFKSDRGVGGGVETYLEPSAVLHCRGLPISANDTELLNLLAPYGKVVSICLINNGQALIEMESLEASSRIINKGYNKSAFVIHGQRITFSYSRSQHLNNGKTVVNNSVAYGGGGSSGSGLVKKNSHQQQQQYNQNILLLSILNPIYPVTTHTLLYIMSNYGRVLRIVIFQKNGLQAFVEFDSIYSAWTAKEALNGQDIYTGSCKLQIEFARVNKLNVKQNDDKTADYTLNYYPQPPPPPILDGSAVTAGFSPPPPPPPPGQPPTSTTSTTTSSSATSSQPSVGSVVVPPPPPPTSAGSSGFLSPYGAGTIVGFSPPPPPLNGIPSTAASAYMYSHIPPHGIPVAVGAVGMSGADQFTVLIVQKLPEENLDSDKLFNLFCLYGNILKIKILHTTKGSALVQLSTNMQASIAQQCLNQTPIYGQNITVQFTKFLYIADSDKTKDYTQSKFNRFQNIYPPITKNPYKPSSTLHFLNVPITFSEDDLIQLCAKSCQYTPTAVKFFPNKPGVESKKQMGLIEFADTRSACEALMDLNNMILENGSTLKLSFTMNTITHKPSDSTAPITPPNSNSTESPK
ncbi:RNA-binding region RNP-1 domain-containing protein [Tieghemostelium lacteum]|uniref:RNA-binding region RNP-1 domain-containing protein n=1 Tax=Tieghemostelium lacteum TaxID=361077 RepID=A0A152A4K4_TIELA|nr:RNA-binding region RNP-1 domain-containing protein [Tieghemostelium lacteum]|eukprot:KYR01173.1 RNA-binding region RNP-1 domain-containing protein [Tieghemostelium lacteum]